MFNRASHNNLSIHRAMFSAFIALMFISCARSNNAMTTFNHQSYGTVFKNDQSQEDVSAFDYCSYFYNATDDEQASIKVDIENFNTQSGSKNIDGKDIIRARGFEVAEKTGDLESCRRAIGRANAFYDETREKNLMKWSKTLGSVKNDAADSKLVIDLKKELNALAIDDQVARSTAMQTQMTKELNETEKRWANGRAVAAFFEIEDVSTKFLERTFKEIDWVDENVFGVRASEQAWLLVQHADRSPEFQKQILDRMKNYLGPNSNTNRNYAYLYDRVSLKLKNTQVYGTQLLDKCQGGVKMLRPVENPNELDSRRKALGLEPINDYLQLVSTGC